LGFLPGGFITVKGKKLVRVLRREIASVSNTRVANPTKGAKLARKGSSRGNGEKWWLQEEPSERTSIPLVGEHKKKKGGVT